MQSFSGGGWGARTCAARERECTTERCSAPQGGDTPLHRAALQGHAAVVELLLAARAVTDVECHVTWAGDAGCR